MVADLFDVRLCPVCGQARSGRVPCQRCGTDFDDPRVAELGRTLMRADAIRRDLLARPAPSHVPEPPEDEHPRPPHLAPNASQIPQPAARSRSVGWLLLGVGALCLAIAAAIFIAVIWDTLGWLARGAIMLTVTAVFAALAELTRRRGLRASAETLSAVAGALWLVTLIAGTRLLPESLWWPPLIGVALAGAGLVAELWHRHVRDRLWAVDAIVAVSVPIMFGGFSSAAGGWHPLVGIVAMAVAIAVALIRFGKRLWLTRLACWLVGTVAGAVLTAQGLVGLAGDDAWDGWRVPVVMAALGVLVGRATPRWVRRVGAGAAGALGSGALMAPTARLDITPALWVIVAIAIPGVALILLARNRALWAIGPGWLIGPAIAGVTVAMLTIIRLAQGPALDAGPWWLLSSVGFLTLALVVLSVHRTRSGQPVMHWTGTVAVLLAWLASLSLLSGNASMTLAVLAVVMIALLVLARLTHRLIPLWCAVVLAGWLGTLVFIGGWIAPIAVGVVAITALGWGYSQRSLQLAAQTLGWLALPLAGVLAVEPLAKSGVTGPLELVLITIAILAGLILATQQWWWLEPRERLVAEIAGIGWGSVAAIIALNEATLGVTALCLLFLGVALGIAGIPRERLGYRWAGLGVLTLSSWALLVDQNVRMLEAYTLPLAVVLLVIGALSLKRNPAQRSPILLPGLVIGLLPSTILALTDPVSIRALLVGLTAVALVLVGVFGRLAAPFLSGLVVVVVLALVELWPYTAYIPRWAGLAAAGILLVAIGVRWEARLRDLRRVGGYVRGLR